jgi:MFS family permease
LSASTAQQRQSPDFEGLTVSNIVRTWRISAIILAQLLCTSLWFSANAATTGLQRSLAPGDFGLLTNSVQVGFIAGTFLSAISGLADRYPASRIFFFSSLAGATANAVFAMVPSHLAIALMLRFVVGVSLAGIYPVGMKLIVGWTRGRNALTLSLLVGTLSLGTALPYGIRAVGAEWPWTMVVASCSVLCVAGGVLVIAAGDGPYKSRNATSAEGARFGAGLQAFRSREFRSAAFGYFGHMWELYGFWSLAPLIIGALLPEWTSDSEFRIATFAFMVIGCGSFGCLIGGVASIRYGSRRTAAGALMLSGLMCAAIPLAASWPLWLRMICLVVWGMSVIADSPQFSNASRNACPPQLVGSALSIQNAIGFAITTISIWTGARFFNDLGLEVGWLLLPGPVLGLVGMHLVGKQSDLT